MGRAALAIALATLVVSLLATASAQAALRWHACDRGVECARLAVPLDRSGARPGTVSLKIERRRARRKPVQDVVFLLAGGPGQSATSAYGRPYAEFANVAPDSDVVAFDQRGTGGSGLLRCRDLEWANGLDPGHATEACAVKLGPRRLHYSTSDSVEDLEAVRQALGGPRVTLIGVSYGTYLAQRYEIRYPGNVNRMVLDSVVDTTGVDALYRDSFTATRRVLDQLCKSGCAPFARNLEADTGALVSRLSQGPLTGTVVRSDGRRKPATLTRQGLFYAFGAGDVNPFLRADYPSAVKSALRGDLAPVLRLQRRASFAEGGGSARDLSTATLAATLCEDTTFPYPRDTPSTMRARLALDAVQGEDAASFAPFDAWTAGHNDLLRFCRTWPTASPGPTIEPPALPDVPTLLLAGELDTRTPVETAERVAARLPRAQLVRLPRAGHSVLGNSYCADRALRRFMRGQTAQSRCDEDDDGNVFVDFGLTPLAPTSLRDVRPLPGFGGVRGRVLGALLLTLSDSSHELFYSLDPDLADDDSLHLRVPGLRGGRIAFSFDGDETFGYRMHRLEYVPGVVISGWVRASDDRARGIFRIGGAAGMSARLHVSDDGFRGRINGRRVRLREIDRERGAATARSAGTVVLPPALRDPLELLRRTQRSRWRPLAGW